MASPHAMATMLCKKGVAGAGHWGCARPRGRGEDPINGIGLGRAYSRILSELDAVLGGSASSIRSKRCGGTVPGTSHVADRGSLATWSLPLVCNAEERKLGLLKYLLVCGGSIPESSFAIHPLPYRHYTNLGVSSKLNSTFIIRRLWLRSSRM